MKGLLLGIYCPRVLGPVVAGLAELGDLAEEKLGVVAAVGRMATQAILIDRGVLPHERAAFFRMALIAELIGGAGLIMCSPNPP